MHSYFYSACHVVPCFVWFDCLLIIIIITLVVVVVVAAVAVVVVKA